MTAETTKVEKEKALLGQELGDQLEKEREEEETNKKIKEVEEQQKKDAAKKKAKIVLKNTLGEEVPQKDYFYSTSGKDTAPVYFSDVCGRPVDREDMIGVFNKIFRPKDGILFYKTLDKEVYIIIVPLKHSSVVGQEYDSIDGEFQKHAISFINEGSVNLDTLRTKLLRVAKTINIVAE